MKYKLYFNDVFQMSVRPEINLKKFVCKILIGFFCISNYIYDDYTYD